jgi:hypothetical protein
MWVRAEGPANPKSPPRSASARCRLPPWTGWSPRRARVRVVTLSGAAQTSYTRPGRPGEDLDPADEGVRAGRRSRRAVGGGDGAAPGQLRRSPGPSRGGSVRRTCRSLRMSLHRLGSGLGLGRRHDLYRRDRLGCGRRVGEGATGHDRREARSQGRSRDRRGRNAGSPGVKERAARQAKAGGGDDQEASGVHETSSILSPRGFFISSASVRGGWVVVVIRARQRSAPASCPLTKRVSRHCRS